TPVYQSQCFCAENQELRCAQAGAVIQVLLDEIGRIRAAGPARSGELDRITHDFVRDRHLADETLEFDDLRSADRLFEFNLAQRRGLADDLNLVFLIEVIKDRKSTRLNSSHVAI